MTAALKNDPVAVFWSASEFLDPDVARDEWARVVMAAKSADDSDLMREAVEEWSSRAANYDAANFRATWRSIQPEGGVTFATLIYLARNAGWRGISPGNAVSRPSAARSTSKVTAPPPPALQLATAEGAVAVYVYCDEHGRLLYRKVRFNRPGRGKITPFQVWRDGQWWSGEGRMDGVRRVLYRLPRILDAGAIYIAEGEKCVDALDAFGFRATCNDDGAGKWRPEFSETLRGRQVVVLPDNRVGAGKISTLVRPWAAVTADSPRFSEEFRRQRSQIPPRSLSKNPPASPSQARDLRQRGRSQVLLPPWECL